MKNTIMKKTIMFSACALVGALLSSTAAMAYDDLITNDTTAGEAAGALSGSIGLMYETASKAFDTNSKSVDLLKNAKMFRLPLKANYGVTDKVTVFAIVPIVSFDPGTGTSKSGVGDAWLGAKYGLMPDGLLSLRAALDIPSGPDRDQLGNPGGYGIDVGAMGLKKVDKMEMNGQVGFRILTEGRTNSWAPGIGNVNKWTPGTGFYAAAQGSYDFVETFKGIVGIEFMAVGDGSANGTTIKKTSSNYVDLDVGAAYNIGKQFGLRGDVFYTITGENTNQYAGVRLTMSFMLAGGKPKTVSAAPYEAPARVVEVEKKVIILVSEVPEPKVVEQVKILAAEPEIEEIILAFEDVHFNFDKSTLTEATQTILKRSIQILKDNPKANIRIAGYTSASGTDEYNQKLSERRAKAVEEYLINEGIITSERLTTIGYGKARPAEYEAAPKELYSKAAKANMRVLFEIVVK